MRIIVWVLLLVLIQSAAYTQTRTIHTFVALCDNANQGIVPVPASLGNGQDPKSNLYWGAAYGLKSYFRSKTDDWELVKTLPSPDAIILERVLFKHATTEVYMLADAYDGAYIKDCIEAFLEASNHQNEIQINQDGLTLKFGGSSQLVGYIGHNGLMEFDVDVSFQQTNEPAVDAIMLACYSKDYFSPRIKSANANPLLWTTHLMAPEAYSYKAALDEWIAGKSPSEIEESAAQMYNKYQKCGINGARNLFSTGF